MATLFVFLKISLRIGNLQMLLQIGLLIRKQKQNKSQKRKKFKIALSLGYIPLPISTTKDVICYSNGYIYHFLDYIMLLLFVDANVIHHV